MGALKNLLLACILLSPLALAQPEPDPGVVGGPVNEVLDQAIPPVENETGEDLTREEIDLQLDIDIVNAEFDILGVLFGGGAAETDLDAQVSIAIRAVKLDRLETALQEVSGDANVTLSGTFGINTSRTVLTAEEIRTAAGGAVLEAFKGFQEQATRSYIESTIPQVTVLSTGFAWDNTAPGERAREGEEPRLREPPIVLNASFVLRFLDRFSLAEVLEAAEDDGEESPEELLRDRIEENQTVPFPQRDAFMVLGVGQLLSMELPPGWRLNLTVTVPQGFTIAGATDALVVSENRRTVTYFLDGSDRTEVAQTSGVVTISDRFLVTAVLLSGALLVGLVLRFPIELGALAAWRRWGS